MEDEAEAPAREPAMGGGVRGEFGDDVFGALGEAVPGPRCAAIPRRGDGRDGAPRGCAAAPRTVHVRDSKSVGGPDLALTSAAWADFVTYASES